jgi:hypothetical protein
LGWLQGAGKPGIRRRARPLVDPVIDIIEAGGGFVLQIEAEA